MNIDAQAIGIHGRMNLTEIEAERLSHIGTKRALAQLSARMIEREATEVVDAIRARLGIVGEFQVAQDGSIVLPRAEIDAWREAPGEQKAAE